MRSRERILRLALHAYPPPYRDERGEEVLATALEAAAESRAAAVRESLSLLLGGARVHAFLAARQPWSSAFRGGAWICAWGLAIINLAVAIAGLTARVHVLGAPTSGIYLSPSYGPYVIDWWWIAFGILSAAIVAALALGWRRLAGAAAVANALLIAYDAAFLANANKYDGRGHFDLFTYSQTSSFPGGREWTAGALVLVIAALVRGTDARRAHVLRLLAASILALLLALIAHTAWGAFFYLRWPLLVLLILSLAFGWCEPRLLVATTGWTLAALPSAVAYLAAANLDHEAWATAGVVVVLATGVLAPLLHLVRRRVSEARV